MCKEGRTKEGRVSNYHTGKWNSVYGGFRILKSRPEGVLGVSKQPGSFWNWWCSEVEHALRNHRPGDGNTL